MKNRLGRNDQGDFVFSKFVGISDEDQALLRLRGNARYPLP